VNRSEQTVSRALLDSITAIAANADADEGDE